MRDGVFKIRCVTWKMKNGTWGTTELKILVRYLIDGTDTENCFISPS